MKHGTGPWAVRRRGVTLLCTVLTATAWAVPVRVNVVDEQGKPVPDAVIFLESPEAVRASKPLDGAEMVQKDRAFQPSVLVVTKGTMVGFPNRDSVRHHVYSFSPAKRFELKLYVGTPANPVVFDKTGVVVLGCNIHDQMLAHVVVVETPWYGRTDAAGQLAMNDVPPGNYRLRTWHGRLPVGEPAQDQALRLASETSNVQVTLRKLEAP